MPLRITYFGHSGFLLESGPHALAIDPFLTGNPVAKHKPTDVRCTHIALTHGHEDHFGDTVELAKKNNATVIGAWELVNFAASKGVKHVEPMNPGGRITTPFGWVALTQAFHSSSYDGRYMGMPTGVVANIGSVTVYHTGDTGLFGDMKLIGEIYKPDVAFICAGDRFTMGPQLASRAAQFIAPKFAVPIHWGTWPPLAQEPAVREHFKPAGVEIKIMLPGETWDYA